MLYTNYDVKISYSHDMLMWEDYMNILICSCNFHVIQNSDYIKLGFHDKSKRPVPLRICFIKVSSTNWWTIVLTEIILFIFVHFHPLGEFLFVWSLLPLFPLILTRFQPPLLNLALSLFLLFPLFQSFPLLRVPSLKLRNSPPLLPLAFPYISFLR